MRPAAHHRLLIAKLQDVADGKIKRLMVWMPPGSAKSTYVSRLFPAWLLGTAAHLSIIGASHTATLAESMSRGVQAFVRDNRAALGYALANESATLWRTTNAGQYLAAGVGGPITGFRADVGLIDDAVKNREAADSLVQRDGVWNWYTSTLLTRLKPAAPVVIVMTRWHEDDLGGRLLQTQADDWTLLSLPAIAGEDDALGRAAGDWLWSDDGYGYGADLRNIRDVAEKSGAMRDWESLYQQNPRPGEGALFKVAQIGAVEAALPGGTKVRGWDLASTAQTGTRDPDWTVGVLMQRQPDGRFVVLDVVRLRGGPDEVEAAIVATAQRDGRGVMIDLPQDPGQAGKGQVLYLTRKLSGHTVRSSPETGDKATRAAPYASQVNVGNVSVLRAAWNRAYLDELAGFPSATKDDQVDASSRGFAFLNETPPSFRVTQAAIEEVRAAGRRGIYG